MELKIAENLKRLRRERGNTQDDLANHLSISVQAVSKWERGDGFPDITLLPFIATFYDVTVDEILGCHALRKQEELEAFKEKEHQLIHQGKRKEGLALCREMQRKYPNEPEVLYYLMHDLYAVDRLTNSEEVIDIAGRLLEKGPTEYRFSAIQMLAFTHCALGNQEKAVEYAKMVPCNRDLLSTVLQGKELVEHCRRYFFEVGGTMVRLSHNMMQCPEAGYTAEERHSIRKALYNFFRIIFPDGDFGFWECRLGTLCRDMALSSAEMGKTDQAFAELDEMCSHMEQYDRFVSIDHTSPLVRGVHYEKSMSGNSDERSMAYGFLCSLEENPRFECLRGDARLQSIKNRLQVLG
jgi:transcriptional regulator with XRE-family HTH domain